MSPIHVNIIDLGAAAEAEAVRYNLPSGQSVIAVHNGLPVERQEELLAELTRPGEIAVTINRHLADLIPAQRAGSDQTRGRLSGAAGRPHAAVAAASATVLAAMLGPLAGG